MSFTVEELIEELGGHPDHGDLGEYTKRMYKKIVVIKKNDANNIECEVDFLVEKNNKIEVYVK